MVKIGQISHKKELAMKPLSRDRQDRSKKIFEEVQSIIEGSHFVYTSGYHGSAYVNKDRLYIYPILVDRLCKMFAKSFDQDDVQVVAGPTVGGVSLAHLTAINFHKSFGQMVRAVFADEEDVLETVLIDSFNDLHDKAYCCDLLGQDVIHESVEGFSVDFTGFRDFKIAESLRNEVVSMQIVKKIGTKRVLKRGYDEIVRGKRVLLVEDIINTGSTIIKLKEAVEACGGIVVGVCALCNRSGGKVTAETLGVPSLLSLMHLKMDIYPEETCPICLASGIQSVRTDIGKGKEFLARKGIKVL
ncbi:MAG: phosphoribosyltransferase family protein [bacterium]